MVYMCVHVCVWSVYVVCVCVHIVVNRGLWLQLPAEKGLPHTGSTTMAPIVILGRGFSIFSGGKWMAEPSYPGHSTPQVR